MTLRSSTASRARRARITPGAGVLLTVLALVLVTLMPATTARAVPHPPGIGPYTHVLVYGDNERLPVTDPRSPIGFLKQSLTAGGFRVDAGTTLPDDLSPYGQIWVMSTYQPRNSAEEARLVTFVKAGGSLLMSGEWSCCKSVAQSAKRLVDQLVTLPSGGLKLGPDLFNTVASPVNPGAIRGAATSPTALTTLTTIYSGTVDTRGLQRRNVLSYRADAPRYATAMVWDSTDLVGGVGGRVALVMDTSWVYPGFADTATAAPVAVDLATFLKVPGGKPQS